MYNLDQVETEIYQISPQFTIAESYHKKLESLKSKTQPEGYNSIYENEKNKEITESKLKSQKNNLRDKPKKKEFDKKLCPGVLITNEEFNGFHFNQNVNEAELKFGEFNLDEKETQKYLNQINCDLKKFQLRLKNGSIYIGYMDSDWNMAGYGILIKSDGTKYEGTFKNNSFWGKGRIIDAQGNCYEGEFKSNKPNGYGKLIKKNGATYIGQWKNNKQHGEGEEIFPDGSRYVGPFFLGNKNGYAKMNWPDGSSYEGNFSNNNFEGMGTYRWKDGRKYKGYWKDKKMEGIGFYEWPDKIRYYGQFHNDMKNGFGILISSRDKKYEGEWRNGKQNGYGIVYDGNQVEFAFFKKGTKEYSLNIDENQEIYKNLIFEINKLKQHENFKSEHLTENIPS